MVEKVLGNSITGVVAVQKRMNWVRYGLIGFAAGVGAAVAYHALSFAQFMVALVFIGAAAVLVAWLYRLGENSATRLLNRESYYRDFFANAIEGIFRTTPDGRYIAVNQALAEIYGYTSPEALLNRLTDIASQLYIDPHRRSAFKHIMAENDQVTDFVSEIRRQDGSRVWIRENARVVRDWAGRVVCYEGTVVDVTAKFEAERIMQQALREAEEANRAKNAFLATMSHELRTPLNAIIGFSEIIKDELMGRIVPSSYRDYASDIHISGVRLLAIINDILDASRLEGGTIAIDAMPNPIGELVSSALTVARDLTGDDRDVTIDIPADMAPVNVDTKRFCQCIAKVLTNAFKFTPEGGAVSVRAVLGEDQGLRLSVTDTGIGMEPSMIASALQPFRQLDGSLARRFGGTGLGLSITKTLVELHGGKLHIESVKGQGTTVTIILPPSRTILHQNTIGA